MWEYPKDVKKALANAKDYLFEFAYWKIWSELSKQDKVVVKAIAKVKTGEIYKIREDLDYTSNQFNPYRNRLLKAGIITGPEDGIVKLCLPWFDEFCQIAE